MIYSNVFGYLSIEVIENYMWMFCFILILVIKN